MDEILTIHMVQFLTFVPEKHYLRIKIINHWLSYACVISGMIADLTANLAVNSHYNFTNCKGGGGS